MPFTPPRPEDLVEENTSAPVRFTPPRPDAIVEEEEPTAPRQSGEFAPPLIRPEPVPFVPPTSEPNFFRPDAPPANLLKILPGEWNEPPPLEPVPTQEFDPVLAFREGKPIPPEPQNIPGFFEGLVRTGRKGIKQMAAAADMGIGAAGDPRVAAGIAQRHRQANQIVESQGMQDWNKAENLGDAFQAMAKNPMEVIAGITVQGLTSSIPGLTLGAAGSVAGPIGTATGVGLGSFGVEYGSKITEALQEAGVDFEDPISIQRGLADEKLMSDAKRRAVLKGAPVAAFDAFSAGVAGKFLGRVKGLGVLPFLKASVGEGAQQVVSGMAGELAGQVAAGEKINWKDVVAEGIGELLPGAIETALNLPAQRRGERVQIVEKAKASGLPGAAAAVENMPGFEGGEKVETEEKEGRQEEGLLTPPQPEELPPVTPAAPPPTIDGPTGQITLQEPEPAPLDASDQSDPSEPPTEGAPNAIPVSAPETLPVEKPPDTGSQVEPQIREQTAEEPQKEEVAYKKYPELKIFDETEPVKLQGALEPLTQEQLKRIAEVHELQVSGTKPILVERLVKAKMLAAQLQGETPESLQVQSAESLANKLRMVGKSTMGNKRLKAERLVAWLKEFQASRGKTFQGVADLDEFNQAIAAKAPIRKEIGDRVRARLEQEGYEFNQERNRYEHTGKPVEYFDLDGERFTRGQMERKQEEAARLVEAGKKAIATIQGRIAEEKDPQYKATLETMLSENQAELPKREAALEKIQRILQPASMLSQDLNKLRQEMGLSFADVDKIAQAAIGKKWRDIGGSETEQVDQYQKLIEAIRANQQKQPKASPAPKAEAPVPSDKEAVFDRLIELSTEWQKIADARYDLEYRQKNKAKSDALAAKQKEVADRIFAYARQQGLDPYKLELFDLIPNPEGQTEEAQQRRLDNQQKLRRALGLERPKITKETPRNKVYDEILAIREEINKGVDQDKNRRALRKISKDFNLDWHTVLDLVQKEKPIVRKRAEEAIKKKLEKSAEAPKPTPPTPPTPEPVKKEETVNIESLLTAPGADVTDARARVKAISTKQAELREQYKSIEQKKKLVEERVLPKRRNRWHPNRPKASANKSEIATLRDLEKQLSDIDRQIGALDEAAKDDKKAIDATIDASIINDPKQPLVRRIDRKIRAIQDAQQPVPPELIQARDAEVAQLILKEYPDATPAEIDRIKKDVEAKVYFGEANPVKGPGVLSLYDFRQMRLDAAVNAEQRPSHLFSQKLKDRIDRFRHGAPQKRTTEELEAILADIEEETGSIRAEAEATAKKEKEESEARAKAEEKLLKEAQEIVSSAKGRSAKAIKDELVLRLEDAVNEMLAADEIKLERREGGEYVATSANSGNFSMATVEQKEGKVRVTFDRINGSKGEFPPINMESLERAEWLITAMAASAPGKAIVAVPGDGLFRLNRTGPVLLQTWRKAKSIDTSKGTVSSGSKAPGKEEPPKSIRTAEDWKGAKEYHGLSADDKISEWSPALAEFAKKIDAEGWRDLTTKDVDSWVEERTKPKQKPSESRIGGRSGKFNIWEADEGDLIDYFDEVFGEQEAGATPGAFGRRGQFYFPTFKEFQDWMDARYAERDLEGMKLAFAEAPAENKVKYIKENRSAPDHKKGWVAHLATGADLPANDPPVARTTPRPMPGQPTPQPGQPPFQQPPPPPPRGPTPYRKFDTMALVQLLRFFDKFPSVNKRLVRAYGRYLQGVGEVEIKKRLLWDTQLAERVLGHEIGHLIDLLITIPGHGLPFAKRLKPLTDFKDRAFEMRDLRKEAKSLSRAWRGWFPDRDSYRDTAEELFADFMSAMFNKPEWVNQNFPKLHDAFTELLSGKPRFQQAYIEMSQWLSGGKLAEEFIEQQGQAVERTEEELLKVRPRVGEGLFSSLKTRFLSVWDRAYGIEGKPKKVGAYVTDQLEYSGTFAAREDVLFQDSYQKEVQPELDRVHSDPNEARKILHSYSQARRTIEERRGAGVWIEQHPVEARWLLNKILESSPALRSSWLQSLESARDDQLYDLSAAIFREAHDYGKKFVERLDKFIDGLDLDIRGQEALMAFNVRGKLLNPGGLNESGARAVLRKLQQDLTPDQWTALENAGRNLRRLLFEVMEKAYNEGLISTKTWNEIIVPNADNYLPYAVLDYWEGKVRAGIQSQWGTAKDIADVNWAAQLKAASMNAWRQRQMQVRLLMQAYANGGQPVVPGETLEKSSDIEGIRRKHRADTTSRAVVWVDGKPKLVEFPGDPGKTFERALDDRGLYDRLAWMAKASGFTSAVMQVFTTLSLPFLLFRNPVRGLRTQALRVGIRPVIAQTFNPEGYILAKNYADAAFGAEMHPDIRNLVERGVLLPPRLSSAMVRDAQNLRDLIEGGGILAFQISRFRGQPKWAWWKGGDPGRAVYTFLEKVFTGYEAFEKIQTFNAALRRGLSEEQAVALAQRGGIPKPGVGGHFSSILEIFMPWTRVSLQGVRATMDVMRDPELNKGFALRFAVTEALPRVLKLMVGTAIIHGLVKVALSPDEDDEDPVLAEVFKRISPYKMGLDDIIPFMLYDPQKGRYHFFNDFKRGKDIPSHYEVVSLRIPASEEGKLWGSLLYSLLANTPGTLSKNMGRPGENPISAMGKWAINELTPGVSPVLQTAVNLFQMVILDKNPEDPYRGGPSANPRMFDAGGWDKAKAVAGYTLNELGYPGEVAAVLAMNTGILDPRAVDSLKSRLAKDKVPLPERIPGGRSALSYDNYARYREERVEEMELKRIRARAKNIMSPEVQQLYDYYYKHVKRQDKLNPFEKEKFRASKEFVTEVWGDIEKEERQKILDEEGDLTLWEGRRFYLRAAHAVTRGSRGSRETVRRDLDRAAAAYVARFNKR